MGSVLGRSKNTKERREDHGMLAFYYVVVDPSILSWASAYRGGAAYIVAAQPVKF